jgi:hypothetical protein
MKYDLAAVKLMAVQSKVRSILGLEDWNKIVRALRQLSAWEGSDKPGGSSQCA